MDGSIDGWMDEWIGGLKAGQMHPWIDRCADGEQIVGQLDGFMGRQIE